MTHEEFNIKVNKELKYWENHFKNTPISRSFLKRTFTRTEDHNIAIELARSLSKNGYKIEQTSPEYDGMVTWYINNKN